MRYLRGTFKPRGAKTTTSGIFAKILLCLVTLIIMCAITVFSSLYVIFKSDCRVLQKKVVDKALENKYTDWIPSVYLSDNEISALVDKEGVK